MPSPYHVTRLLSQPPSSSHASVSGRGGGSSNKWGPYSSGADFDAYVVMIVAIVICAAALILSLSAAVRFLIRRRRCARAPPPPGEGGEDPEEAEKRKQRDGSELARALPVVVFREGSTELVGGSAAGEAECSICLSEFAEGEGVRVIPACRHGFHGVCIERWFQTKSSCPTCRCSCRRTAQAAE